MSNLGNKEIMARNIKKYMNKKNVNQVQLCSELGFKQSTFSDWVNAKTYPRIDKIELLANYFGIEKSDLVEDKPDNINDPELIIISRAMKKMDKNKKDRLMTILKASFMEEFNDD